MATSLNQFSRADLSSTMMNHQSALLDCDVVVADAVLSTVEEMTLDAMRECERMEFFKGVRNHVGVQFPPIWLLVLRFVDVDHYSI
jgi:hypothetical protein